MIILFGFISLVFVLINYQIRLGRVIGYSVGISGFGNEVSAKYLTENFPTIALTVLIIAILLTSLFTFILTRSIKSILNIKRENL